MTYTPVSIDRFRGLAVVRDTSEVGADRAVDGNNFDLDHARVLKVRPGYAAFLAVAGANRFSSVGTHIEAAGDAEVLASSLSGTFAFDANGVQQATDGDVALDYQTIGTPTTTRTYVAMVGNVLMHRYESGVGFTSIAGSPKADFLALMPNDNRLVAANLNGEPHKVQFSDPGDPETWGANNYVILTPGDSSEITGACTYRDQVFIFKRDKFFVFYGNSTSGTGTPIFNYRPVDTGVGAAASSFAVSPNGIYFLADTGVFITDGGPPRKVSGDIDSLFTASDNLGAFSGGRFSESRAASLAWWNDRLVISLPDDDVTSRILVFDPVLDDWMYWTVPAGAITVFSASATSRPDLMFTYSAGANQIAKMNGSLTTDAGTAITASWQSGFSDLGNPEVKSTRESFIWGTGSPTFSVFTDFATTDANAASVTLGSSAIDEGYHRIGYRGVWFSHKFSGSSWAVARLVHHVRESRMAGVR